MSEPYADDFDAVLSTPPATCGEWFIPSWKTLAKTRGAGRVHVGVTAAFIGNEGESFVHLCAECARDFGYGIVAVWDGATWLVPHGTQGYFDRWRGTPGYPLEPDHRLIRWLPKDQVRDETLRLHGVSLDLHRFWT